MLDILHFDKIYGYIDLHIPKRDYKLYFLIGRQDLIIDLEPLSILVCIVWAIREFMLFLGKEYKCEGKRKIWARGKGK